MSNLKKRTLVVVSTFYILCNIFKVPPKIKINKEVILNVFMKSICNS
jgi:hypothetical protein